MIPISGYVVYRHRKIETNDSMERSLCDHEARRNDRYDAVKTTS